MSVATRNPFAILDADSSPPTTTEAPSDVPLPSTRGNQRGRGGPASRGGKYYQRGGASKSTLSRDGPTGGDEAVDGGNRKFDGESRGRGRGRGGRGRGEGRGRGRPFDRHSQTGKSDSDKKVSQSWGGEDGIAELKIEDAATADASAEKEVAVNDWAVDEATPADDPWGAPAAPADDTTVPVAVDGDKSREHEGRGRREREPEEEDNTLTLEQYLAQKKEQEASLVPKLEGGRKPNEGADQELWKDVVELKKDDTQNAYFVGKGKAPPKPRAKKEEKVHIEIDATFPRPSREGRGGRGGRGRGGERGDRGRGSRGAGRGAPRGRPNGSNNPTVSVDDPTAFPSLS